jgi:hypothetical protein
MKILLIAFALLLFPLYLNAQDAKMLARGSGPVKTETREFPPSELHDVKLDMYDGGLTFTVANITYTYQPNFDSVPAKIAASATLLSELRLATKVLVEVELPSRDHVYSQFFVLQFDSLK